MSRSAQEKHMTIEFLGMKDGCPHTPTLWNALNRALRELNWDLAVDTLDVYELSRNQDRRAGYGSPTILVNGKDLFDAAPATSLDPACRYYRAGLPDTKSIVAKLRAIKQ
jgi:hypothetical protein